MYIVQKRGTSNVLYVLVRSECKLFQIKNITTIMVAVVVVVIVITNVGIIVRINNQLMQSHMVCDCKVLLNI